MARKSYPSDVLQQARIVLDAWNQINTQMTFGDLNMTMLSDGIGGAAPIEAEITSLETRLTGLRDQRDDLNLSIWDMIKRVRAGVKANYGDNSHQYEMIGGTRASERKVKPRRPPEEQLPT